MEEPPKAKAFAPLRRKDPPIFKFPGTVLVIEEGDFTHEGYDHAFLKPYNRTTPPEFDNRSLMEYNGASQYVTKRYVATLSHAVFLKIVTKNSLRSCGGG